MKKITEFIQQALGMCEHLGLIVIAIATLFAAGRDVSAMLLSHAVTLGDLLMMFLYLEVLSMVRQYLMTGTMPVRYPLYIGIVAMTRYIVLDMKELAYLQVVGLAAATLLLALAILVVRYGHVRFPYPSGDDGATKLNLDKSPKEHP